MAFLSTNEFAERCGLSQGNLANYKSRGKCRMTGDFYDDKDPINVLFLAARKDIEEKKKLGIKTARGNRWEKKSKRKSPKEKPAEPNFNGFVADDLPPKSKQPPERAEREYESQSDNDSGLQVEKMKADIARINSVRALNELKIQKQQGELIPTELVRPVIAQLAKSLASNFKSGADNLIVEMSHRKKMTGAELAELRAVLVGIINDSISKSVSDSKKMSEHIARDYTNKEAEEVDDDNE